MSRKINDMWHGIPRQEIPWFPAVSAEACIGCTPCLLSWLCPVQAISFPSRERIWKLKREWKSFKLVRHVASLHLLAALLITCVLSTPRNAAAAELVKSDELTLSLSGFVAVQSTFDTNDSVLQSHLTNVPGTGNTGRTGFAFDASRFRLDAVTRRSSVEVVGRLEVDLESAINFRVRHACVTARRGHFSATLGQTDTLVGNWVGPHSWNNDWYWAQGNAYDRLPQARLAYEDSGFMAAVAAVPSPVAGHGASPHGQARLGYRWGEQGAVGIAGHFGTTDNAEYADPAAPSTYRLVGSVRSWMAEADLAVPVSLALVSFELWYGEAAGHGTGGSAIGGPLFVVDAQNRGIPVPAFGGFVDVLVVATSDMSFGAAGGIDIVNASALGGNLLPVRRNATATVYAAYLLTSNAKIGFDVQWAGTSRALSPDVPAQIAQVQDVRGLLGLKLIF